MITITPGPMELGLNRDAYEDLVDGLTADGVPARLEPPQEFRSGRPIDVASDLAVYLGEHLGDAAFDLLLACLIARLSKMRQFGRRKGTPRHVEIYGPDGRVIRRLTVPGNDGESDPESHR